MENKNTYPFSSLNLRFTAEAVEWLAGTTTDNNGKEVRNISIFADLLKNMRTKAGYDASFRRPLNLMPGQVQFSEIGLAQRWNLGRKKIHNLMSKMEAAALVETYNSRIGSAMTFSSVMGWINLDGEPEINGLYTG